MKRILAAVAIGTLLFVGLLAGAATTLVETSQPVQATDGPG